MSVCTCVCCICVYMCTYVHKYTFICGSKRPVLRVTFNYSLLYFLRQAFLLNLEPTVQPDRLASELQRSACFCFPPSFQVPHPHPYPTLYMSAGNLNLGPCAFKASALPTGSSPQSHTQHYKSYFSCMTIFPQLQP